MQRARYQAGDALQIRRAEGAVARAGREGPRHLTEVRAATSTPAEHVLDLSVGFRPLPQTTRSSRSSRRGAWNVSAITTSGHAWANTWSIRCSGSTNAAAGRGLRGARRLPQTTRSRVSCRAPGRRHPAGAGTARASGPSRTIRPGRAGTFKMYQDRLPVGRSWCARCGAHQADKLALDNTPVCARCWLPTDEQAANSPPTSSEGINLRLPTAAHLRRGKP